MQRWANTGLAPEELTGRGQYEGPEERAWLLEFDEELAFKSYRCYLPIYNL